MTARRCRDETLRFDLSVGPSKHSNANTIRMCFSAGRERSRVSRVSRCIASSSSTFGRMTECVRMNTLLVKFHTLFLPELPEGPHGHHLLEEVASRRHETLGFVLKCTDPHGPPRPTPMCTYLSAEGDGRCAGRSRHLSSTSRHTNRKAKKRQNHSNDIALDQGQNGRAGSLADLSLESFPGCLTDRRSQRTSAGPLGVG